MKKKFRIKYSRPRLLILWLRLHGMKPKEGAIYTWGSIIFAPSRLPDDLITHERRHVTQQEGFLGPWRWWWRFAKDPAFRLEQETQAYGDAVMFVRDRVARRKSLQYLFGVSDLMASPMYGGMCNQEQARARIQDWCRTQAQAAGDERRTQIR